MNFIIYSLIIFSKYIINISGFPLVSPTTIFRRANNAHGVKNRIHQARKIFSSSVDLSIISPSNSITSDETISFPLDSQFASEINSIKFRLEKMEKSHFNLQNTVSSIPTQQSTSRGTSALVGNFVDSLTASTISMNPRTVEIASIFSFFFIGAILGASLFDRLWLVGGILSSWWASGAVYKDTRGGLLARKVGVQLLQFVKDIQEKYNQAIIFYRTGRLAYVSSRIWEKYDKEYKIETKINEIKKLAMKRATEFNTAFQDQNIFTTPLADVATVLRAAPSNAARLNEEYGVTSSLYALCKGLYSYTYEGVQQLIDRGSPSPPPPPPSKRQTFLKNVKNIFKLGDKSDNSHSKTRKFKKQQERGDNSNSRIWHFDWKKGFDRAKCHVKDILHLKSSQKRKGMKRSVNPWGGPFNAYRHDGYIDYINRKENR